MSHNLSINGFALTSGAVHRFTIVNGTTVDGVVTRTGSNVVEIRMADGATRELGQCSIVDIRPVPAEIDVERVAFVLMDAMGSPIKAAAVTRETVMALLRGGATIADRNVIALERAAIRLDELAEIMVSGGEVAYRN